MRSLRDCPRNRMCECSLPHMYPLLTPISVAVGCVHESHSFASGAYRDWVQLGYIDVSVSIQLLRSNARFIMRCFSSNRGNCACLAVEQSLKNVYLHNTDLTAAWGAMLGFDLIIFSLTLFKALTVPRVGRRSLFDIIIRDGKPTFQTEYA